MSDPIRLQGSSGLFGQPETIKLRKLDAGVSLEQVKQAAGHNNLDENVVEDAKGQRYVAYADELSVAGSLFSSGLPPEGATIELAFIDGPVKVLHVNNERNEDLAELTESLGTGGLGVGSLHNPAPHQQNDRALKKISTELS